MVDTAWTFMVIFMTIGAVLVVFAAVWINSQRPHSTGAHMGSKRPEPELLERRATRSEVPPVEDGEQRDELDGELAGRAEGRAAELVHS